MMIKPLFRDMDRQRQLWLENYIAKATCSLFYLSFFPGADSLVCLFYTDPE